MDVTQGIGEVLTALDGWLDTMRCPGGYGGPVVHWWGDSLAYTGGGLDWRYEGIISGYLNLYRRTNQEEWLSKARRAGDDLVKGQLSSGVYRNSGFEINPQSGGTPHEAACDLGLLKLASVLRDVGGADWQKYADVAVFNLEKFVLGMLWDQERRVLRNTAYDNSFVPNKAATTAEAFLTWAALCNDEKIIARYCVPILDAIVAVQIRSKGIKVEGAIPQASKNDRYFPYYMSRCIPALIQGYQVTGGRRYLTAAQAAMRFILRYQQPDGAFPQVIYREGRHVNHYPRWIAAVGDILRAMSLLEPFGEPVRIEPTLGWLLKGRQANGSIRTAGGFASIISQRPPGTLPDFRDVLGVCGWSDKAFHYLTSRPEAANVAVHESSLPPLSMPCSYRGRPAILREDDSRIEVRQGQQTLYYWRKGTDWAQVCGI